jgi:hypothetical protein
VIVHYGLEIFDGRPHLGAEGETEYSNQHHMHEMQCWFGKFPTAFLESADQGVREMIFDEQGFVEVPEGYELEYPPLETLITNLQGEGNKQFVEMLKAMLVLDPSGRKSAELLEMDRVKDPQD